MNGKDKDGAGPDERLRLGVNIDHVATLRQVRGTPYPDLLAAAEAARRGGADLLTVHLREDRRHIQDADVAALRAWDLLPMNLEIAITGEMLATAAATAPAWCCLVPERRAEVTTEGGLDVGRALVAVKDAVARLHAASIRVSLFIDPDRVQIDAARECGADAVELHTGRYADAPAVLRPGALEQIAAAAAHAAAAGLEVHAGHGLHYDNVQPVAALPEIVELNIGHALVARSVFVGLEAAVREMKSLCTRPVTG
mgnify:CR=1 FL=1